MSQIEKKILTVCLVLFLGFSACFFCVSFWTFFVHWHLLHLFTQAAPHIPKSQSHRFAYAIYHTKRLLTKIALSTLALLALVILMTKIGLNLLKKDEVDEKKQPLPDWKQREMAF